MECGEIEAEIGLGETEKQRYGDGDRDRVGREGVRMGRIRDRYGGER